MGGGRSGSLPPGLKHMSSAFSFPRFIAAAPRAWEKSAFAGAAQALGHRGKLRGPFCSGKEPYGIQILSSGEYLPKYLINTLGSAAGEEEGPVPGTQRYL